MFVVVPKRSGLRGEMKVFGGASSKTARPVDESARQRPTRPRCERKCAFLAMRGLKILMATHTGRHYVICELDAIAQFPGQRVISRRFSTSSPFRMSKNFVDNADKRGTKA